MVGISTSYFAARGFSIYESVKRAHQMGFRLIELGANHDYEENIWETVKKIKKDFPDVLFTLHCYFPPIFKIPVLSNASEGLTKDNQNVLTSIFKAAKILKAKVVSFHPGINNRFYFAGEFKEFKGFKKFQSERIIPKREAFKGLGDFLYQALKLGDKNKIPVAIENIFLAKKGKPTIETFKDFSFIFKEFSSLYFLFDYGHATLLTKNPNQFFKFGKRIIEMHLHDVNKDNLDHRILGEGKIDLPALFLNIKKLKKRPYLILEHSGEPKEKEIIKEKELVEKYLKE